jgi:hypothetical protein
MQLSPVSSYLGPFEIHIVKSDAVLSQRVMASNVKKNCYVFLLQSLATELSLGSHPSVLNRTSVLRTFQNIPLYLHANGTLNAVDSNVLRWQHNGSDTPLCQ